jgi:hypothetical protein
MSHINQPSVSNDTRRLIKTPYRSRPLSCQHLCQPQIIVISLFQSLQITYPCVISWPPVTCDFLCTPLQGVNLLAIRLLWGGSLQIRDNRGMFAWHPALVYVHHRFIYILAHPCWCHYCHPAHPVPTPWKPPLDPHIRCASDPFLLILEAVTPSGTLESLLQASWCHLLSPRPRLDIVMFISTPLGMYLCIGWSAWPISGSTFHQGWSPLSIMIGSLLSMQTENQAGLLMHQPSPQRPGRRRSFTRNQCKGNTQEGELLFWMVGNETHS